MNFHLKITASARSFYDGECESLILPTIDGQYGVLAMHENTVVGIDVGEMRYKTNGEWVNIVVGEGFAKISGNNVIVLVESAELPSEIDYNRAMQAKMRAEEHLQNKKSLHEYYQGKLSMNRAMARLKVKEHKYI